MSPGDNGPRIDFLLLMEDYQGSYTNAFLADPAMSAESYETCAKRLFSRPIYYGDAYLDALTSAGFTSVQVVPMCRPLQFKWAHENSVWNPADWLEGIPWDSYPVQLTERLLDHQVLARLLAKQIAHYRPSIVWLFSGTPVTAREVRAWGRNSDHSILWWSSPLKPGFPYREFDVIVTGIPSLLRYFGDLGVKTAFLSHAFDRRILTRVPCSDDRAHRVAFVGSLSEHHHDRAKFLDALSRRVPVDFYGHGEHLLPEDSPLRRSYHGSAWGDDLYAVYGSHLLVVHKNIDVAEKSASAKRLFEATGMGACVVTEESDDLEDLFVPDVEIVTYSDLEDCATRIELLLKEPDRAAAIGRRGQARTLADHTYERRVEALAATLRSSGLL